MEHCCREDNKQIKSKGRSGGCRESLLAHEGCFVWLVRAVLIWVTSIRQGRMERSVLTAGRALMISCEGRRAAAPWSASDCTWAAPVRTAGLQNGTCGDTRACLALRNSWTNVIGGNRARFSVGEVGWIGLMESQNAAWHSGKSLRD